MRRLTLRVSATLLSASLAVVALSPAVFATGKPTYAQKMETANMLFFNGDVDRAIHAFEQAAELNPKAFEPHMNLLNLYIQKGGDGALEKAVFECQEVLKRRPQNKDVHLVLGNLLRNQASSETDPEKQKAKMAEAIKEVQTAETMGARKSVCEYTVGMIKLQMGETDQAMANIDAALADQPDLADAHMVRAVLMFKQIAKPSADGKPKDFKTPEMQSAFQKVLDELDVAIKQKPKNPEAHNTKAEIELALGRLDAALADYRKAVEEEPKYTQAWVGVGTCEAQLAANEKDSSLQSQHIDKARDAFQSAKKLNPNDKNVVYGLAVMLEKMGRFSEAADEFENSMTLETDPQTKAALANHLQQLRAAMGMTVMPGLGGLGMGGGVGPSAGMFTNGSLAIPMKDLIQTPDKDKK